MRIVAYIDPFSRYHGIVDLGENHLKWLDVRKLCEEFCPTAHDLRPCADQERML